METKKVKRDFTRKSQIRLYLNLLVAVFGHKNRERLFLGCCVFIDDARINLKVKKELPVIKFTKLTAQNAPEA